ncbi:MAG TPA: hypothetical protein ENI61_05050 [Ignavibacteria bacterium]|nr:hypothetical protein [Ignavibacteria bacterium]
MRIGIVRNDIVHGLHLDDFLPSNQYPYASQVAGQSRKITKMSPNKLNNSILKAVGDIITTHPIILTLVGSDGALSVDTSTNNVLRIRDSYLSAFTIITVTINTVTAKTLIALDLNTAFIANNLSLRAVVVGTNKIQIQSESPNTGAKSYLEIDTIANGSTLNIAVGFIDGVVLTGAPAGLITMKIASNLYPTSTTINVSQTAVIVPDLSYLSTSEKVSLTSLVADLVSTRFTETGDALLSFKTGKLSKMRSAAFRPGGSRVGLPAGTAVAVVEDDGSTQFV